MADVKKLCAGVFHAGKGGGERVDPGPGARIAVFELHDADQIIASIQRNKVPAGCLKAIFHTAAHPHAKQGFDITVAWFGAGIAAARDKKIGPRRIDKQTVNTGKVTQRIGEQLSGADLMDDRIFRVA